MAAGHGDRSFCFCDRGWGHQWHGHSVIHARDYRLPLPQPQLMEAGALKGIYGRRVRAVRKRQLNKKEIQRLLATLKDKA